MTPTGDNFWLNSPEKIANPYLDFDWFRRNEPIHFHEPLGQWFVFRHDDVSRLFSDPRMSAERLAGMRAATPAEALPALNKIAPYFEDWVLMTDGEAHKRLRTALHAAFDAKIIAGLRGNIETAANGLLDGYVQSGRFDVCEDFAFLLTAYVLADFLGVHPSDRDKVVQWSMDFIDYFNIAPITAENTEKMAESGLQLMACTKAILADRRLHPKDDFPGALIRAEQQSGALTEDEMVANSMLLLLAGHIAVRNFIGNTVWLLFQHPEALAQLRVNPSLLESAIEESLRFETPVLAIPRIPREDFTYGGQTFRQGQIVQLVLSSANRDPAVFPDADRFDITRRPGRSLSFGHGPHACMGALLAKEETQIALRLLLERTPNLRPDPDRPVTWYRNLGNRGPVNLPVLC